MATQPHAGEVQVYDELRGLPERPQTGFTYTRLVEVFPEEDNVRRELIGGELIVPPSPSWPHQEIIVRLVVRLSLYAERHGGKVFPAPLDVYLSETDVVEPDVLFVRQESFAKLEGRFVRGSPDLVIEVSSPSTRRLELVRKRQLYERFGVPEYWYVDPDADRVEVFRLVGGSYGPPAILGRGDILESEQVEGFRIEIDYLLGQLE